jgi:hypothetical protein
LLATSQASQASPQAVSQQKPSMQLPLVHSAGLPQPWPSFFLGTQRLLASQ